MSSRAQGLASLAVLSTLAACTFDANTPSAQTTDGAVAPDGSAAIDSSVIDAAEGLADALPAPDAAPPDAAPPDAAPPDAAPPDAAPPDAAPPPDAGKPDAVPPFVDPTPITGVMFALAQDDVVIDGDLSEWGKLSVLAIGAPADYVQLTPSGAGADNVDISAAGAARWTSTHLYIGIIVTDNVYQNDGSGASIWQGDSVQVAFDVAGNGGAPYDTTDDFEYGWARASGDVEASWRWIAPNSQPAYVAAPYNVVRNGATTTYEVSLTAADLGLSSFTAGTDIRFSWIANDADGSGREGFIEWTPGIGSTKDPSAFDILRLHPTGP